MTFTLRKDQQQCLPHGATGLTYPPPHTAPYLTAAEPVTVCSTTNADPTRSTAPTNGRIRLEKRWHACPRLNTVASQSHEISMSVWFLFLCRGPDILALLLWAESLVESSKRLRLSNCELQYGSDDSAASASIALTCFR